MDSTGISSLHELLLVRLGVAEAIWLMILTLTAAEEENTAVPLGIAEKLDEDGVA